MQVRRIEFDCIETAQEYVEKLSYYYAINPDLHLNPNPIIEKGVIYLEVEDLSDRCQMPTHYVKEYVADFIGQR